LFEYFIQTGLVAPHSLVAFKESANIINILFHESVSHPVI
jgi:hypothetical protein